MKSTTASWQPTLTLQQFENRVVITRAVGGVVAVILCLTGVGAVVGVPLLVYLFLFLKAPRGVYTGQCPECGHDLAVTAPTSGFDCPTCKSRILREEDQFRSFSRHGQSSVPAA